MTLLVRHRHGDAAELFGEDPLAEPVVRSATFRTVVGPTVVLGSAQPLEVVDAARAEAARITVVRRRSGGGAVWLDAGSITWVDVTIPAGDGLWEPDVGKAFWWLGEVWAGVLGSLGVAGAAVHRGALVKTTWSTTVCFAGLGAGEVTLGQRKVVGIAQRRTRAGALFQCGVLHSWDPEPLLSVLALSDAQRQTAGDDLRSVAVGVPQAGIQDTFRDALRAVGG